MSQHPDLRVLCRRLISTPPPQLPHSIPAFVNHVLRCKDVLSAPQDPKAKDGSSDTALLVHKLRTIITTLVNGKRAVERFTGATLVKAVIDVGGWECLKESGVWVRALLSMIQKNDTLPVKEIAVITLVRIYTLVHDYQTLTREIATPTIPTFFNGCLSLIKLPGDGKRLKTPLPIVETILEAFSTLIPLYPTTCRPFNGQIRTAIRPYLAPTADKGTTVPETLRQASRHLAISLPLTTAGKTGPSDDWAKLVEELRKDFHSTADQVFRAVQESWEPSVPYTRSKIDCAEPPQGIDTPGQLPAWKGISAGRDRLVGLLQYLTDALRYSTKTAVTIPIGALMDIVSRVSLISRNSKSQSWEQALETQAAIGREEKEELWAAIPDVHVAALDLVLVLVQRLEHNALSLAPEIFDNLLLVFRSGINIPAVRVAAYRLLNETLPICGPGLQKLTVETLSVVILACCRDIQQEGGFVKDLSKQDAKPASESKKNGAAANADLFLSAQNSNTQSTTRPTLAPSHLAAACALLANLLTHLPQRHLKPGLRGLLDQTAVLSRDRDAMLASVLNPYVDPSGAMYPSILPHLTRQFPRDQGLEVLRSNMRAAVPQGVFVSAEEAQFGSATLADLEAEEAAKDGEEEVVSEIEAAQDEVMKDASGVAENTIVVANADTEDGSSSSSNPFRPAAAGDAGSVEVANPFAATSAQKRKLGEEDASPPKRQSVERKTERAVVPEPAKPVEDAGGDDDSDDESVHLNMDLDDDEEDDNDE
ncbi:Pre-rRNA-processing protein rix1 [Colletotrichum sidae]|uniref:Pre-rRNA-processing protein RIX1 n=1 Tax=Colletotrichum sidae TaxID=1347389 RepID=A0A4R8T332_9PEZI|nr:Pre-rRNA-processing protein rix1 [Colletotrichum sidae]